MQTEKKFEQRQAQLSAAKRALLEKRLKGLSNQPALAQGIAPRPAMETAPLSFAQQRLWFLQQLEPESAAYNEAMATRLKGPLNREAFTQTLREIIRRHEVLRCRFPLREGQVTQFVDEQVHLSYEIPCEDWRSLEPQEQETAFYRRAQTEMSRPFNLTDELPWRTFLFQLGAEEYFSLTVMHHIITDGWSLGILYREIGQLYAAFSQGKPSPFQELPLQYGDYAYWQQQWLQSAEAQAQLAYWQQQLQAPLPVLDLSTNRVQSPVQSHRGQQVKIEVPREIGQRLQELSRQTGATLFMVLLTAWFALLHRYSQQDDLIVGTPIAGRLSPELEALMGCFVNTLVLRMHLADDPSVKEAIQRVREITLGAYDHQQMPFEKLVEVLQPERNLNRNPLFQTMFVLQNVPVPALSFQTLELTPIEVERQSAKFDLELVMEETAQGLSGYLEYNTDFFDSGTAEQLGRHFVSLLQQMSAYPDRRLSECSLLTPQEERQVIEAWNARPYPCEQRYHHYFAQQVERTPTALAVRDESERLTYHELNQRAERIAAHLRARDIRPERLVGLYTERSANWAAAVLATFKTGGVYLPLDPHHPATRLQYILRQSGCRLILTSRPLLAQLSGLLEKSEIQVYCLEDLLEQERSGRGNALCSPADLTATGPAAGEHKASPLQECGSGEPCQSAEYAAAHLAYVIYTSGSTGHPKGAMVEHAGMLNHLFAKVETLGLTAQDVVAQTASQCFDISVWQLLAAWLVGAQVRIYPEEVSMDAQAMTEQLMRDGVSIVEVVPSFLRAALQVQQMAGEQEVGSRPSLGRLRWMIATGEALAEDLCKQWLGRFPTIPLLNAYGPTECSDDVTHQEVWKMPESGQEWQAGVPIGKAIGNMRVYVLSRQQRLQPMGVRGEIYVGGVGVGRGYLDNPLRTAEMFMPDPWGDAGERMYRTGDVGCYRPDGAIEYLGRVDQQVKIRGYRIEPGEIEAVIREHPAVQEAVVVAREGAAGNKRLVAYLVHEPERAIQIGEVQGYLKVHLPEYMVPAAFVCLETLPLLPNGKLDRKALPEPDDSVEREEMEYVAPRTPTEERLASIWAEVLTLKQVGIYDNFFAIGGHSLLITQVLTRVQDAFQLSLPVRTLFKNPTIAGLAQAVEKVQSRSAELRRQAVVSISRETYRQKRN